MRVKRSTLKMILTKRNDVHTLTDLRFIIALKHNNLSVKGRPENMKRIMTSNLSWQKRIDWTRRINEYVGPKGENIEWLKIIYNSDVVAKEKSRKKSERMKGEKNPWRNHGGKYSPFSKKSDFYDPELSAKIQTRLTENYKRTTQIEYYLNKGYGLCQAKAALKERQSVGSLDKFVKRYNEEEGYRRWKDRQIKWQKTLNDKSPEEKALINSKKCSSGYTVSRAEKELYDTLKNNFEHLERALSLPYNDFNNYYVYDIVLDNKIIEYNGDIWHANPELFDENFINPVSKMKATDIWKKESDKEKVANEHGYKLYRVWENDYKTNKDKVIEKCINFLKQ